MTDLTPIAVAIVERDGQFLVGRRPSGVPLADFAEFPGGKIKPGEAAEGAAVRECLEETGIEIEVTELLCRVQHEYEHGALQLHFFMCRVVCDGNLDNEPSREAFRWVSRHELAQLEFPSANDEVVKRLY